MTVPLDRLYHYIESIAQDIRGDAVVIYRFYPHGSKKIESLQKLRPYTMLEFVSSPHMYCNDQEPLNYDYYQNSNILDHPDSAFKKMLFEAGAPIENNNFKFTNNVYDKALLLHSEERSPDLEKYKTGLFIPVYYWCHALISLDWFRYAQHVVQRKQPRKKFLIYNRAWAGTREYRLKFSDLLIHHKLHNNCAMFFNPVDPETGIHYKNYKFKTEIWKPNNKIEDYFKKNTAPSYASADFDLADYEETEFEVVLETLFDNGRLYLTEKVLRPIAVGQPFLHVAPHGSLEYLRRYGFKTFDGIIDESYDTIEDPTLRLLAVIKVMETIANWTDVESKEKQLQIKNIVDYNRAYFFSDKFFNFVIDELNTNIKTALQEIEDTNTGMLIDKRKLISKNETVKQGLVGRHPQFLSMPRSTIGVMVKKAREYYLRNLQKPKQ